MIKWLIKLWKDGVRYRFLRWAIPIILPHHHVARNGSGRRKKMDINAIAEEMGYESPLGDEISNEYRTSSKRGNWPGDNSLGD